MSFLGSVAEATLEAMNTTNPSKPSTPRDIVVTGQQGGALAHRAPTDLASFADARLLAPKRRISSNILLLLSMVTSGCGPDSDSSTSNASGSSSGSDSGSASDDGSTEPTSTDTGADTAGSTDPNPTDTGADPVDPSDLPFGGFIYVSFSDASSLQGVGATLVFGAASFYEVEHPDHPDFEPSVVEVPLEPPRSEDEWLVWAEYVRPDPSIPLPMKTFLEVSPQILVDGGGLSFSIDLVDPKNGLWEAHEPGSHNGGDWSFEIPAFGDFPAERFDSVLAGPSLDAIEFELVVDADGVPVELVWVPQEGTHEVRVSTYVRGLDTIQLVCFGSLADDGEASIPPACLGEGLELEPGLDTFFMDAGVGFAKDVAYGDHRVRLQAEVGQLITRPFPFEPG